MKNVKQFISTNIVLALAVIFVVYHIVSTFLGLGSFAQLLLSPETKANVESSNENTSSNISRDNRAQLIVYGSTVAPDQWPKRIVITSAQINMGIVGKAETLGNLEFLPSQVTYVSNTALPNGRAGNTVMFGTVTNGPFQGLKKVKTGDEILIELPGRNYTYQVVGFRTATANDLSMLNQSLDSMLTLVAADQWKSPQKYIVSAKYIREAKN